MPDARNMERLRDGMLPSFTSVGAYPFMYVATDVSSYGVLCADCATREIATEDTQVLCDVYWEGDAMQCDECNADIESAYGPVEGDTDA